MKRLILFLLFFIPLCLSSQSNLNVIRDRGSAYLAAKQYPKALITFKEGLEIARQQNDATAEGFFLIDIGVTYQTQNDIKNARNYFDKALSIGENKQDLNILAYSYLNLGILLTERAVYEKATEYLLKSESFFKQDNNQAELSSVYNTLGYLKNDEHKYKKALEYHRLALAIRENTIPANDSSDWISIQTDIASSLNNIGEVYKNMKQYDEARYYLSKALLKKQVLSDTLFQATTLTALAEIYQAQGKTQLATGFNFKAYALRKKYYDRLGIASSANRIGSLLMEQKKYTEAELFLDEAEEISRTDSINNELLMNYGLKRQLYRILKQDKNALHYDDLYIQLAEVVFNEQARRSEEDMLIKHDVEKKEEDHKRAMAATETANNMMAIGLVLLGTIIVIVIFSSYQIHKAKQKIESLWQELNHRVKNTFQIIISMINIQSDNIENEESKKVFADMEKRIHVMGSMYRKLYMDNELTPLNMHEEIEEMAKDLKYAYHIESLNINTRLDELKLIADKAIPLGLIANELLTNAFKYALPNNPDPSIAITLTVNQKNVQLIVQDNGPGFPEGSQQGESYGYTLINSFCSQLNGSYRVENKNGACVTVTINL